MIPVSVLATLFYFWEAGLPDIKYPFNLIWGGIYFVLAVIFVTVVFSAVFSIVSGKDEPKAKDCIKVTAGVFAVFFVLVYLIGSRG